MGYLHYYVIFMPTQWIPFPFSASEMVKARQLFQKFKEEIVASHQKGNRYKEISKFLKGAFKNSRPLVLWLHDMDVDERSCQQPQRFLRKQVEKNPLRT